MKELLWRIEYAIRAIWTIRSWGWNSIPRGWEMANALTWKEIREGGDNPKDALREELSVW
jgi:hypothetical protein